MLPGTVILYDNVAVQFMFIGITMWGLCVHYGLIHGTIVCFSYRQVPHLLFVYYIVFTSYLQSLEDLG